MTELNRQLLKNLTQLSRIAVTEEEEESLLRDLQKILIYADQLQSLDTQDVPPCYSVLDDLCNVLREDIVNDQLPRALFLANAPDHVGGLVRVPPVLKGV